MAPSPDSQTGLSSHEPAGQRRWLLSLTALLLVAGIMYARRPELFTTPRFWAEEGEVYFSAAYHYGFWQALFSQHMGYYAIIPNLATALATLVPLEFAPFITTYIAFTFQILVSALVIYGQSPFWDTWPKKLIIACGIQLINPFEVWLTSISVHFWLCIATFLILLESSDNSDRIRRTIYRTVLIIAGLSSVVSLFLAPLFLLKAWRDRLRESWIHGLILVFTAIIQGYALLTFLLKSNSLSTGSRLSENRFSLNDVVAFHLFDPFIDWRLTKWIPATVLISIYVCLGVYLLYLLFRSMRDGEYLTIYSSFFLVSVLSTLLSINLASSPRYAFAPSVMLLVILVNETFAEERMVSRWLALSFVIVITVSSITGFRKHIYYSPDYPQWQEEVKVWRTDTTRPLKIWPQFKVRSWKVDLTPVK